MLLFRLTLLEMHVPCALQFNLQSNIMPISINGDIYVICYFLLRSITKLDLSI